jgi:squalene-hopene/tetraprenyl-beta-curcumene cyclase
VARKGLEFLRRSARGDGSWAIDSNLRTWVTTLATRALLTESRGRPGACPDAERIAEWLVRTQLKAKHPFTGAQPGGWAWTDLPGGVPDADDTAGALIALKRLRESGCRTEVTEAVRNGVRWLLDLQNADGGMPTFCRGWGRLPFDRSCPDISAHALAALAAWASEVGEDAAARGDALPPVPAARESSSRAAQGMNRLVRYLAKAQEPDGSWLPLWFGHQEGPGGKNPVIGTARVVDALRVAQRELGVKSEEFVVGELLARGERWLLAAQRADGGWGMGREATVEETALAVTALTGGEEACRAAAGRGAAWLTRQGAQGLERAAPIGLYFALLWYHERLYPLVWALEALGRNCDGKEGKHVG